MGDLNHEHGRQYELIAFYPQFFERRYGVLKRLGAGGMGSVYLAEDSRLDRRVALKIPHASGDEPEVLGLAADHDAEGEHGVIVADRQGPGALGEARPEHRVLEVRACLGQPGHPEAPGGLAPAQAHELGEHEGQPFIAMERLEGQTVRQLVENGPMPIGRAAGLR